jgi:23S rRNA (uracil1939-C5)-methyltransferase
MNENAEGQRLEVGEALEATVEKGVYRGVGLARHRGEVVFVRRGLPGDRLLLRVVSAHTGHATADVEAIVQPSPLRRGSPCAFFARCGGCAYQELDYGAQLALKEAILRETLLREGTPWEREIPLKPSPEAAWRTRVSFHLGEENGRPTLGLHEESSRRVVDLPNCLQLSEAMNRTARSLVASLEHRGAWRRLIRDVHMAESLTGDQLVLALDLVGDGRDSLPGTGLLQDLAAVTGAGVLVGRGKRRRFVLLRGDPHVEAEVNGLRLRSHVESFFQANRFLIADLTDAVRRLTPAGGTVLDLYAGVGLFALTLARDAHTVRAAEWNRWAVEDAKVNVRRAELDQVSFERGAVLESLATWPTSRDERIILDPPRTGAGAEVVRAVTSRRPEVVIYVSCDPPTLARDLKVFDANGYRPDHVEAFDLFPDTFHLESLVRLRPR